MKIFGYRTAAMSGRQEPRSKHRHDPALEKYKKARQDMHPGFSRPAGGPPGLPLVQQLSMQRGPGTLLLTQTLMSSEWSLEMKERGRALTEDQTVTAQMRRRRSQFLQFSTSLVRGCTMVSLRHVCPMYPPMFPELITEERV